MGLELTERFSGIDLLINNAAVSMSSRTLVPEGYEMSFSVNYLAPVLLTGVIRPLLIANGGSVLNVSSVDHHSAVFDPCNMQGEQRYSGYDAYARSKLFNIRAPLFICSEALLLRCPDKSGSKFSCTVCTLRLLRSVRLAFVLLTTINSGAQYVHAGLHFRRRTFALEHARSGRDFHQAASCRMGTRRRGCFSRRRRGVRDGYGDRKKTITASISRTSGPQPAPQLPGTLFRERSLPN